MKAWVCEIITVKIKRRNLMSSYSRYYLDTFHCFNSLTGASMLHLR